MPLISAPMPIPYDVIWDASNRAKCITYGEGGREREGGERCILMMTFCTNMY